MTQPTRGFGLVEKSPRSARRSARAMCSMVGGAERRGHQRPDGCAERETSRTTLENSSTSSKLRYTEAKSNVGDLVELLQLAHDHLADLLRSHFALAERQQLFFDTGNRRLDGIALLTGRLRSASNRLAASLSRSKSTREPFFLMICGRRSSARS
jgi:hypothetical protein